MGTEDPDKDFADEQADLDLNFPHGSTVIYALSSGARGPWFDPCSGRARLFLGMNRLS